MTCFGNSPVRNLLIFWLGLNLCQANQPKVTIIILSDNAGGDEYLLQFECSQKKPWVEKLRTTPYYTLEPNDDDCRVQAEIQANGLPTRYTPWKSLDASFNNEGVRHLIEEGYNETSIGSKVSVTFCGDSNSSEEQNPICNFLLKEQEDPAKPYSQRVEADSHQNCVYQFPYQTKQWNYKIQVERLDLEVGSKERKLYKCLAPKGCNLDFDVAPNDSDVFANTSGVVKHSAKFYFGYFLSSLATFLMGYVFL